MTKNLVAIKRSNEVAKRNLESKDPEETIEVRLTSTYALHGKILKMQGEYLEKGIKLSISDCYMELIEEALVARGLLKKDE